MASITRAEFSKIYREQFLPILEPLEVERAEAKRKATPFFAPCIIFLVIAVAGFLFNNFWLVLIGLVVAVPCIIYMLKLWNEIRDKLKKQIITKILTLCGNMYLSDNKDVVSSSEIDDMGLFPRFSSKSDDDVIIGLHKGCNFAIEESHLTHQEGSGKNRHTVTDFNGLIVKIQMNKSFNGKTVAGMKSEISKRPGFDEVKLEDVEFMKHMKVFSTDQIEARYLLTTAMIERLYLLGDAFSKSRNSAGTNMIDGHNYAVEESNRRKEKKGIAAWFDSPELVCAAFIGGYVYLFIPKSEDFFEIDAWSTLLNETKYYDVYCQLQLILSVIDYLKLDLKLGL